MDFEKVIEFGSNHWILSSGYFVVSLLLIQDLFDTLTSKHKSISASAAVAMMNDDKTVVLDVRESHEFAKGHIENAQHIPLASLDEKMFVLEQHKDAPIIVTCQQGTRSLMACKKLTQRGFSKIHELRGGMQAWEDAKLPVVVKKK
ncbi:MAG: rhodanese-like domain-containing protein [Methylococcaceae bacterium]|nr:rhodanese-like domain-containing protein [Methylococcaceae bacterium]